MSTSDFMVHRAVVKEAEYSVCCTVFIYTMTYLHMALSFLKMD
jgi:hypothetical protein